MLIAVEGCVGSGKSTVAKGLAACRRSRILLEEFEKNPFLSGFYQDPIGNNPETEFTFLLLHFHQLKSEAETISGHEVISDFHLAKDLLYAELNLKDAAERRVFLDLYGLLAARIPAPALMICLSASDSLLIERIRRRNREFESGIDASYYEGVNAAYERFFSRYEGPKLRICMDDWDFARSPALYAELSRLTDQQIKASEPIESEPVQGAR
jgi:deoxyadenosine/deoxycytidine kinase